MATLMGIVAKLGSIEATYEVTVLGEKSVKTKKEFSDEIKAQAKELIELCDELTPEIGDVVGVQLYTPISDPANDGKTLDLLFKDSTYHRVMTPPSNITDLSDAFEAAVTESL